MHETPSASAVKPVRPRRLWIFRVVAVLLAYLLSESLAGVFLQFTGGIQERVKQRSLTCTPVKAPFNIPDIAHPYQGFVVDPIDAVNGRRLASDWGYIDDQSPLRTKDAEHLLIAITGGSVAEQFARNSEAILQKHLQTVPRFANRKVEIVHLALGGYKQPQQLMQLNYLLTLGAEFDMVINLDGFNELVHSISENAAAHVVPSFPRMWHAKIEATRTRDEVRLRERVLHAENMRIEYARFFNESPVRYSFLANFLWDILNARSLENILQHNTRYAEYLAQKDLGVERTGPFIPFKDHADLLKHCVQVWRNSSRLMHNLCKSNDITYFHCLQPNQYFEGSKLLTEEELKVAYNIDHGYRQPVIDGYPLLVETGKKIRDDGIPFLDLTQVFASETDSVYSDECCHLRPKGDHILAEAIGEFVANYYANQ